MLFFSASPSLFYTFDTFSSCLPAWDVSVLCKRTLVAGLDDTMTICDHLPVCLSLRRDWVNESSSCYRRHGCCCCCCEQESIPIDGNKPTHGQMATATTPSHITTDYILTLLNIYAYIYLVTGGFCEFAPASLRLLAALWKSCEIYAEKLPGANRKSFRTLPTVRSNDLEVL